MNAWFRIGLVVSAACFMPAAMEIEFKFDGADGDDAIPSAIVRGVEEAYALNAKGLDALDKGDLGAALSWFEDAVTLVPGYVDAENNRGVVYFRKGTTFMAREIWEGLTQKEPAYAIAWHNLGVLAFHENAFDKAKTYFERALKENRRFVESYIMMGRLLLRTNERNKAVEQFARAFKISPDDPDTWSYYAYALIQHNDTAGARVILQKHTGHHEALRMLGMIAATRGDYTRSAEYLSDAVARGADTTLLITLASTLSGQRKYAESLETIRRFLTHGRFAAPADVWILAAIAARETGDLAGARSYLEQGLEQHPRDPILRYNLGQIYFHQKEYKGAERVWESLTDTMQDPALHYLRALGAFRLGDLAAAREQVKTALRIDPKGEYHDLLGVISYRQGNKKEAERNFRMALKADPRLRSAQLNLALIAQSGDELGAALEETRRRLASCTDSCEDVAFQLALLHYYRHDFENAIAVLDKISDEKKDERIYRHLALFHRRLHRWDRSIALLEKARSRFIVEPRTHYDLAETCLLAGRFPDAIAAFTELVETWSENPWRLYYQLGYAYMEHNELEKARHFFERSIKSNPDNAAARGLLAFVHNREGNVSVARELWEKNLKEDPGNAALWINLGLSYEQQGDYSRAIESYTKAGMLAPDNRELQINIGNAYAGMNRDADALHAYTLALNSSHRERAAYNIFLISHKKKDFKRAREMLAVLEREFRSSDYTGRARGEMALQEGDTALALRIWEKLGTKEPDDWCAIARIYAVRGMADKAHRALQNVPDSEAWLPVKMDIRAQIAFSRGDCEKALALWEELGDTSFYGRYNFALAALTCGRYGNAIKICSALVSRAQGKDRADVCRIAGNAAFGLRQWERARQWYRQLSDVEARDPVVQYNLAVASYNLNDSESAWKYYTRARQLNPELVNRDIENRYARLDKSQSGVAADSIVFDTLDSWYNRAVQLQQEGNDRDAGELYHAILGKDPHYVHAWNNLGAIYGAQGEFEKAEECYLKAVQKRHDLPESYANLINIYLVSGNFNQARRWLIKGRGHNPDSELLSDLEQVLRDSLTVHGKSSPE